MNDIFSTLLNRMHKQLALNNVVTADQQRAHLYGSTIRIDYAVSILLKGFVGSKALTVEQLARKANVPTTSAHRAMRAAQLSGIVKQVGVDGRAHVYQFSVK